MKKYSCNACNYSSNRYYDIKRHNQSKKHLENQKLVSSKNDEKTRFCRYCSAKIEKSNISRHHKTCKQKDKVILENEKEKIIKKLEEEIDQLKKELEDKQKMEIEKRNIEQQFKKFKEMYLEHMKALMDENKTAKISNYNVYNMYYVQQNFQDAHNYEDLMAPPLTQNEIHLLENNDVTFGAFNLFK
jgi:hypothetical protein